MRFREQFEDENRFIAERYELAKERIIKIISEETVQEPYRSYFKRTAEFITEVCSLWKKLSDKRMEEASEDELENLNQRLYADILPDAYEKSYANPAWAVKELGEEFGKLLSFVYTEIRAVIGDAYEGRLVWITVCMELFIEIYNMFEGELPVYETVRSTVYWFISDYADIFYSYRIRELFDPSLSFAMEIIMESDLEDLRYLYRYGEYISDCERKTAEFLNSLPQEEIEAMAATYTDGYRRGFVLANKDLSKKKTVSIRYRIGFERIIREAVRQFEAMGLQAAINRYALHSVNRAFNGNLRNGFGASVANRQYDYDHRRDSALYFDKAFYERKFSVMKVTYERYADLAGEFAGPSLVEVFGEKPFIPANKKEAYQFSEKQQKLMLDYTNEASLLMEQYIPGEETSFTIIAFPTPEIGSSFEEIFKETVRINTLDYECYKRIQQTLIDVLDKASCVRITGTAGNRTDLTVWLSDIKNPEKETNFENCLADVNIPLGEVFTSPRLKGTNGTLHVSQVYLKELLFKDLEIVFEDGCIRDYNCANFADREQNRKYISENIMMNHPTLPLGEFAIGTNTTAYAMAKKYDIIHQLPILIVEKMGPHFAVGDTCYSHSEDVRVYNPDGKEITARENDYSRLRTTDMSKAYFNCHTDITIPYDEIGKIVCCTEKGEETVLLSEGRFVLPGTELLNEALCQKE